MARELQATHEGTLKINGKELPVAVLNDGRRIITQNALFEAFGRPARGSRAKGDQDSPKLPGLIDANNLKQFISSELISVIKPINYTDKNDRISIGHDATVLPLICDVYLDARDYKRPDGRGVLTSKQMPNVLAAEILIRSLSRVGIIALVDEVTGHEKEKEKDALQKFLDTFLNNEMSKWIPTFDNEFFEMIFKMKGWTWKEASVKRPSVVGHYINDLVYSRIGPNVLSELRIRNPKNEKGNRKGNYPQFITTDFGHPKLKEHLASLIALGRASGYNWTVFLKLVDRAFPKFPEPPKQGDTLRLDLK
ncbi:P63C domain-containing protein [Mucilaginibacter sp.]|uniref:P63C domain-containing protein n=1 Tax=Mucilaginibacter sp. TaxID=1882438 RepID=UPI003D0B5623